MYGFKIWTENVPKSQIIFKIMSSFFCFSEKKNNTFWFRTMRINWENAAGSVERHWEFARELLTLASKRERERENYLLVINLENMPHYNRKDNRRPTTWRQWQSWVLILQKLLVCKMHSNHAINQVWDWVFHKHNSNYK